VPDTPGSNVTHATSSGGDSERNVTPFCLATIVATKAIESLLAAGTTAVFKDEHPWLVAQREFLTASKAGLRIPLLLASHGESVHDCEFSHWAYINDIDVLELSGKRYMTSIALSTLWEVSPLFTAIDSVYLKPPDEQLLREDVEGGRTQRIAITEQYMRPYAICESPGFISRLTPWLYPTLEA